MGVCACWQTMWTWLAKCRKNTYGKTTKALKKGFGATLKASFAGWDTADRYYRLWNNLFFPEFVDRIRRLMFCTRNVARKLLNGSEFNKNADSLTANSTQITRKSTQIPAKVRKSGFLNCCSACMWQIASNRSLLEWKLLFLQTTHAAN